MKGKYNKMSKTDRELPRIHKNPIENNKYKLDYS